MNVALWISIVMILSACSNNTVTINHQKSAALLNSQLALNYINAGEYDLAEERLILSQKEYPNFAGTESVKGLLREALGDAMGAERYYLKSIALSPDESAYINNYAAFLCRTKRYEEAINYYVKSAKKSVSAKAANAYEGAGTCRQQQGDLASSLYFYQLAMNSNPSYTHLWLEMSDIAYQKGEYHLAENYLKNYLLSHEATKRSIRLLNNIDIALEGSSTIKNDKNIFKVKEKRYE